MAITLGNIETIFISSRIRLARNFAAYPFPSKMDDAQAEDLVYLVEQGLKSLDEFQKYDLGSLSEEEILLLQEQYLISPALAKNKRGAAFVSADATVSIMVNEEDHLREQYICKDFDLFKAYERISAIDETLGSLYDFAFDRKLGYLTACPSNLGTGMRASVMLFLPGLVWNGELKELLPKLRLGGLTVRGAFGEGTQAEGYTYQISNERTLGMSEAEILNKMWEVTLLLCDLESKARQQMLLEAESEIKDRCLRAYGTLTHCALLGLKECNEKLAEVKLGLMLGFLETADMDEFEEFVKGMRSAAFIVENRLQNATEKECDEFRAQTVGKILAELVKVTRESLY